ncbi:Signal transduction histidine kinase [Abditibacterium utsteinense]|uniref:histidine kinase n=1 Tax=Abditibacterium utsteinense TaxID=1960156 RepID=A0A2S8SPW8_9BACT|nr:ATP-binding protein [Abditibacterium utsteinense]PQV62842.1 Signal transduction histidine kinase [Abditibacterium utsteinense]
MGAHSETIIILAATARDATLAGRTLENGGFFPYICSDISVLESRLAGGAGAILLSEEVVTPDLLGVLEGFFDLQAPWSDLPIVFLQTPQPSSLEPRESPALSRLRARGNLSILEHPLRQPTLLFALESALRARRRQYQVRNFLEEKEADVRRRDEFLAMLGHELRNPLAAIRYAIDLLEEIDGQKEPRNATKTPRDVIARQTAHLARLVDDLLDVARVTRGKIALDLKPLDLSELAPKTIASLENARSDGNHNIVFVPSPAPLLIRGDAVRIEQIFSNLLYNAVKYTPPGGRIEVSLVREEQWARVRFEDDGVGMSPELLSRVFDLFSQAESEIDRSRGGLGIGLTLVRGLVELHGGEISAFSEGEGQGSRFEIRFPLLAVAPKPVAVLPAPSAPTDGRRVLLVEDNDDAREILGILLKMSGHHVDCASDGQEGVEKAIELRPEIALVDIGLPILDGYQVAAQLRAALGSDIFLIALTGYGQPEDKQRALDAGFDEHMTKPVEPARLHELLRKVAV